MARDRAIVAAAAILIALTLAACKGSEDQARLPAPSAPVKPKPPDGPCRKKPGDDETRKALAKLWGHGATETDSGGEYFGQCGSTEYALVRFLQPDDVTDDRELAEYEAISEFHREAGKPWVHFGGFSAGCPYPDIPGQLLIEWDYPGCSGQFEFFDQEDPPR